MLRKSRLALFGLCAFLVAPAHAQISDNAIRIGVLTDLSGTFADMAGPGSVAAVELAVADFGGKVNGVPIEVLSADHQNKPDVGLGIARQWYDSGVDAILDMGNSTVAAGVNQLSRSKKKLAIISSAGSSFLTGKDCAPFALHWSFNNHAVATSTVRALSEKMKGGWYFLTVNYSFGQSLEEDAMQALKAVGGKVVGSARHPLNTADFSQLLLQATGTNPTVIALASAGNDVVNAIKQAREFGIGKGKGPVIAPMLMQISDVHGLGLEAAQGIVFTEGFYWNRTDESRAWSERFFAKRGRMPTMNQAALYSATMHYLRAIQETGSDDAEKVVPTMRKNPVNDMFAQNGRLRPDGQLDHDFYLVQVKSPAESKRPWDYYNILAVIPGKDAFIPIENSACPDLKKK